MFDCRRRSHLAVLAFACCTAGCSAGLNAPRPGNVNAFNVPPSDRRIELRIQDGTLTADAADASPAMRTWIDHATQAIEAYYGRFPVERARMMIERLNGNGIRWARTFAYPGAFVRVGVGDDTSASQFASDWMLTHEFIHLALPQFADEHDWLQEGAATYVEPIARAQAGQLTAERVWTEFMSQMPQGQPARDDRGLDRTPTWSRTYWGGALYCLVTDVEIRKRTDNRYGLQDALRAILIEGGTLEHRWPLRQALEVGDRATGATVLMDIYEAWREQPVRVDLDQLWRELGVERQGKTVVLHDDAPFANVRRAITARPQTALVQQDLSVRGGMDVVHPEHFLGVLDGRNVEVHDHRFLAAADEHAR